LQFPNQPFTYDDSGSRYFVGVKGKLLEPGYRRVDVKVDAADRHVG